MRLQYSPGLPWRRVIRSPSDDYFAQGGVSVQPFRKRLLRSMTASTIEGCTAP